MHFYETHPIIGNNINCYVKRVGICVTKWDVHLLKPFEAHAHHLMLTNALEAVVEADGDVESLGDASSWVYLF